MLNTKPSCCQKLTFGWASPFLKMSRSTRLEPRILDSFREDYKVQQDAQILKRLFKKNKNSRKKNALASSVFESFNCTMISLIVLNTL